MLCSEFSGESAFHVLSFAGNLKCVENQFKNLPQFRNFSVVFEIPFFTSKIKWGHLGSIRKQNNVHYCTGREVDSCTVSQPPGRGLYR